MHKKLLAIFAHPDDEAFGPGGTLARYGGERVEIHLLSATRGEAGDWDEKNGKWKMENRKLGSEEKSKIEYIRERELLKSAKILGIKSVEFLDFVDGRLCNAIYHRLAEKIIKKIEEFKPQVILTTDRLGVSGHLDHIAVSMITTYSFLKTNKAHKLYYYCIPKGVREANLYEYFIYFPEGYDQREITTRINYEEYWQRKKEAMKAHKTQMKDVTRLLRRFTKWPKTDHFILQHYRNMKPKFPETDLFAGIEG